MKPYCHLRPEKESKLLITLKSRQKKKAEGRVEHAVFWCIFRALYRPEFL